VGALGIHVICNLEIPLTRTAREVLKLNMDDPKNNFVEMIKIWEHHYSVHPVAIIIYDSTGAIEVQLGRKISGDRDHFKLVTSEPEIVEIQRKSKTGKDFLVDSPNDQF